MPLHQVGDTSRQGYVSPIRLGPLEAGSCLLRHTGFLEVGAQSPPSTRLGTSKGRVCSCLHQGQGHMSPLRLEAPEVRAVLPHHTGCFRGWDHTSPLRPRACEGTHMCPSSDWASEGKTMSLPPDCVLRKA